MGEAAQFAAVIERIARNTLAALAGLSDELLNRPLDLPETNTLFALATHLAGAGEFWTLALAADQTRQRDKPAEFRATGTLAALTARYADWIAAVHATLDPLPDSALTRLVHPPAEYLGPLPAELSVRECLLHAVEHAAQHLGHIELTRQLLGR